MHYQKNNRKCSGFTDTINLKGLKIQQNSVRKFQVGFPKHSLEKSDGNYHVLKAYCVHILCLSLYLFYCRG